MKRFWIIVLLGWLATSEWDQIKLIRRIQALERDNADHYLSEVVFGQTVLALKH